MGTNITAYNRSAIKGKLYARQGILYCFKYNLSGFILTICEAACLKTGEGGNLNKIPCPVILIRKNVLRHHIHCSDTLIRVGQRCAHCHP